MRGALFVVLAAALACSAGCATGAYQSAESTDTAAGYHAFLEKYPNDGHRDTAESRVVQLDFDAAQKLHTPLAYKRFLDEHPNAEQAAAARALLEGLRFNTAEKKGTLEAWRLFLVENPVGAHHADAERRISKLEQAKAASSTDPAELKQLFEANPSTRTAAAAARLDDETFAQAQAASAAKLIEYLERFPAGNHREAARTKLLALKLEGLLSSGLLAQARADAQRSPLAKNVPGLAARIAQADRLWTSARSKDTLVRAMRPDAYVRGLEDLKQAVQAADPLQRWQAVQEMGQHVSVAVLDPLIQAYRAGRNPLVREAAFESLASILRALPPEVSEYEVATRIAALRPTASSPEVYRVLAMLMDLSGDLDQAATEYQRGFEPQNPDPVVLWRWMHIREERRQPFSGAVAARQLALWAQGLAEMVEVPESGPMSLASARQLCAAARSATFARTYLAKVGESKTEFPDDVRAFSELAATAERVARAKLTDAELLLKAQDADVRTCADASVEERIAAGEEGRLKALEAVSRRASGLSSVLLQLVSERDPSPRVRAAAQSRLAPKPSPSSDAQGAPGGRK